jgi:hypothetical protein
MKLYVGGFTNICQYTAQVESEYNKKIYIITFVHFCKDL